MASTEISRGSDIEKSASYAGSTNLTSNQGQHHDSDFPEAKKNVKTVVSGFDPDKIKFTRSLKLSKDNLLVSQKGVPLPITSNEISMVNDNSDHEHFTAPGAWPLELILVRHGQSEGNEATARSSRGDLSCYTPEFQAKHSSTYRLTTKGRKQAIIAGKWIKEHIGERFDRYYTSEYVRAMETAALLDLPDAQWLTEIVLRERDKGQLDNVSTVEKKLRFKEELERRKRDAFFWSPLGGESLAQVCIRIDHTLNTLRRECSNKKVIIVCHGEVMWAFRVRVERLSQIKFHELSNSQDPKEQMHNTQIIHYSRVHPITGEVFPEFRFMRSSCPYKPEASKNIWEEFQRPIYSNQDLLESVSRVPQYVDSLSDEEKDEENDEKANDEVRDRY